jgi:signal transduction histidine kinase
MYLNDALKATTRAAKLSSLMLDYTGTRRFIPEEMDLNHLLEKDKDLKSAVPHTVTLEIQKGENLPQICGNPPQIQQVLMSVVNNSVESIADKPGEIRLTTGMMDCDKDYLNSCRHELKAEPGRYVFVEVADTGLGMDAQTLELLFDPFFTTKFTGRGLGMAAVLGIVRGHDGTIFIESEPDKGTTIRILFPASSKTTTGKNSSVSQGASIGNCS